MTSLVTLSKLTRRPRGGGHIKISIQFRVIDVRGRLNSLGLESFGMEICLLTAASRPPRQFAYYCFGGTPPRKCCHGSSNGSILKFLLLNKFLYIFRKSHQIWLNYLSPFLSCGQKSSRVVPNTPPWQNRVKMCFPIVVFR